MTRTEFIRTVADLVVKENKKRGNPLFSSVVIGQACCETGYGQSKIMMKANAIFGIKASKSWKGKVYNAKTKECYDGVQYTTISACFRAYDSLADSVADYFNLICKTPRYKKACNTKSPLECITAIKNGGYATSPTYIKTIMEIIYSNNLVRYDNKLESENTSSTDSIIYKVGTTYTTQVDLKVRAGAGTNYRNKTYLELTSDGRKHAYKQINAVLKKGTKVTCQGVYINDREIWLKIPSGFIAGYYKGQYYVK